jgi:hypothetical protein
MAEHLTVMAEAAIDAKEMSLDISKEVDKIRGEEIAPPDSLAEMIRLAKHLSKDFPYVRVDFYDVDGRIYFGEITQHHGGGGDNMRPFEWDEKFGAMIHLPKPNVK